MADAPDKINTLDAPNKPNKSSTPDTPEPGKESARLVSLDAFRGFAMLLMVSEGLGLSDVARKFKESRVWQFLDYESSHAAWTGCAVWDLIQPSFMFIVGVAMPYSYAARKARGDGALKTTAHVLWRALALIALGIFLRSNRKVGTNFTFEDVTTQLGLGYAFVYLFLGRGFKVQLAGLVAILFGYWLLFALWPFPGAEFDPKSLGLPDDWKQFTGFAAHWNKYRNPAGYFDVWFMNLFPRSFEFKYNGGGYQTLSFIPSMGTTLFGIMAGEMLRSAIPLAKKFKRLAIAGVGLLALGMALDGTIWPFVDWHWSAGPIVKRIWTPTWAIFSTGWALLFLAAFVWLIDIRGWRRWSFPLIVVGMNSVAMYVMAHLFDQWIAGTYRTHLGKDVFSGTYGPILHNAVVTFTLWLFCLWLYRRKVFIRL